MEDQDSTCDVFRGDRNLPPCSNGDKPVICLDGLPNFWVAATSLPRTIHRRLVVDENFKVVPVGPKTHVSTVSHFGEMRVFVQKALSCSGLPWDLRSRGNHIRCSSGTDLPNNEDARWYVRQASPTLVATHGFDVQAPAGVTIDDTVFQAAMDLYSTGLRR